MTHKKVILKGSHSAPKYMPDIRNYPAYDNHSSFPGAWYFLKIFKCMFATTNQQAKDFPKTRTSEKE